MLVSKLVLSSVTQSAAGSFPGASLCWFDTLLTWEATRVALTPIKLEKLWKTINSLFDLLESWECNDSWEGLGTPFHVAPKYHNSLWFKTRHQAVYHGTQPIPSFCLHQSVWVHHQRIHNSRQQNSSLCCPSVWGYDKHHHHLDILWLIPLFLPQILPARWYALPSVWRRCTCRKSLPGILPACLPPLGHCRFWTMCVFFCSSSFHHHQDSSVCWRFSKTPQT